jgi:hypothetical protein
LTATGLTASCAIQHRRIDPTCCQQVEHHDSALRLLSYTGRLSDVSRCGNFHTGLECTLVHRQEPNMDVFVAIGQLIAIIALACGAALCIKWRDHYETETRRSKLPKNVRGPQADNPRGDYVSAAETDPAS